MSGLRPTRSSRPAPRFLFAENLLRLLPLAFALATGTHAQMSVSTAVDLALRSNPRVLSAQDDVRRASDVLSQTHDVYVPAVNAGAGIGQAYGYLPNPPTLFTVTAGSLVYNISQMYYIRSASAGVNAARLALQDAREQVAEDTALAFIALDHDRQREQAIRQQTAYVNTLVTIEQDRVAAGQDTQIDLTQARLTAAQLRLAALKAEDDTTVDREHLARLVGLPPASMLTDGSFPTNPVPTDAGSSNSPNGYANAAVASAFSNAAAKQQQARGDSRFRFWPQINLVVQYNRYATFTNSFATLEALNNQSAHIGADEAAFGVQIALPVMDRERAARGRESADQAAKALHDAQAAQIDALDSQSRTRRTITELQAQAEVAALQQQLAQQQLDVIHLQMQSGTGNTNGPQMTPKDDQNARIAERDKYLAVLDAGFQLHQAEIQLLRQMGGLEAWLKAAAPAPASTAPPNNLPATPTPQP